MKSSQRMKKYNPVQERLSVMVVQQVTLRMDRARYLYEKWRSKLNSRLL